MKLKNQSYDIFYHSKSINTYEADKYWLFYFKNLMNLLNLIKIIIIIVLFASKYSIN